MKILYGIVIIFLITVSPLLAFDLSHLTENEDEVYPVLTSLENFNLFTGEKSTVNQIPAVNQPTCFNSLRSFIVPSRISQYFSINSNRNENSLSPRHRGFHFYTAGKLLNGLYANEIELINTTRQSSENHELKKIIDF